MDLEIDCVGDDFIKERSQSPGTKGPDRFARMTPGTKGPDRFAVMAASTTGREYIRPMTRAFFSPRVPGPRGVRERFAYQRRLFEVPGQAFDRNENARILSFVV